ncbi:hypothetical protein O4220_23665 [Rhodococcus ruber]|uniref:Uncharacterized protein n=1 Tax=Rhodococcus ruber TaxID=1830 RepID=A0ABT4MKK3_9NOCA|nr:hypothetical protein [Rhodococcus ruber]MCZ4521527.1 hypothetical protein [Rhodococcus ruber]
MGEYFNRGRTVVWESKSGHGRHDHVEGPKVGIVRLGQQWNEIEELEIITRPPVAQQDGSGVCARRPHVQVADALPASAPHYCADA